MTPAPTRDLLAPTLWALFSCALAALALVWLPLSVLQLIDGLLVIQRPLEIARDLALLWPMAALPALMFALLAWTVWRAFGSRHSVLAWGVLLVPVAWLCVWQFARSLWLWLKVTTETAYVVSPELRLGVVAALAAVVATIIVRRHLGRRIAVWLVAQLVALRSLALMVIGVALAATALWPPKLLGADRVALGTTPAAAAQRPDIILISIDSLAAEDANACGASGAAPMPNLRRIAQRAHCFSRYYATANFTSPTISSMETGTLPWSHLAVQPDAKIIEALRQPSLAGSLRGLGYETHSITDNLLASPRQRGTHAGYASAELAHTTLIGNAFREAMTMFPDTALPQLAVAAVSFLGAFDVYLHGQDNPYESTRVYDAAQAIVAGAVRARPLFLWAHTLPPHSPYLPPPSTKYRLLGRGELERWQDMLPDNVDYGSERQPLVDKHRLRYRESMMAADAALGVFLDRLERDGRLDQAILVVTADHGESFEHGFIGHAGPLLHEALIRIPLLIKLPRQHAGGVIDLPVSQADLAPTLLDLAGAPALPAAEGRSLAPLLTGRAALAPLPVLAMSLERQSRFRPLGSEGHFAVIDGNFKLVTSLGRQAPRLFDLSADPGERTNLATQAPQRVVAMESIVRAGLARAEKARSARLGS